MIYISYKILQKYLAYVKNKIEFIIIIIIIIMIAFNKGKEFERSSLASIGKSLRVLA